MDNSSNPTYTHKTISSVELQEYTKNLSGHVIEADTYYSHIEYMNSPQGIIVLAHRDDDEVIEGIHPANLSDSINNAKNIIHPLADGDGNVFCTKPIAYNQHWMTRRSQGNLVLAALGKMIDSGDEAAPHFLPEEDYMLQMSIYDTPNGPVFLIFPAGEYDSDVVHVIRPAEEVEFLEEGQTKGYGPEFVEMKLADESSIKGTA